MPESAEEVYARVIGQVGEHGRLPMPPGSQWDVFPYEGEMVPKVLQPPVEAEQPRSGARSGATSAGSSPAPTPPVGCR